MEEDGWEAWVLDGAACELRSPERVLRGGCEGTGGCRLGASRVLRAFFRTLPIWRLIAARGVKLGRRRETFRRVDVDCRRGAWERAVVVLPLVGGRRLEAGRLRVVWVSLRGLNK